MKLRIFLLLFIFYSCNNPSVEESYYPNGKIEVRITEIDKNLYKSEKYFENGKLQGTGFILGTVNHGLFKTYFENGSIESIYTLKMGKRDGVMRNYNQDGEIRDYQYYFDDKIFYAQIFEDDKIVEEHVIPIITEKIDKNGVNYIDITIPFNDTLDYYNSYVDVFYKFSKDSTTWGNDKEVGEFRFDKFQNKFEIEHDIQSADSLFIKTLSVINGSEVLGYLNIKRIKGK